MAERIEPVREAAGAAPVAAARFSGELLGARRTGA